MSPARIIYVFVIACLIWTIGVTPGLAEGVTVAVIKSRDIAPYNAAWEGVKETLERKGISFHITEYDLGGNLEKGNAITGAIKTSHPDIVLTLGTAATQVARQDIKDIPIVFCVILNPVASGLVNSMRSSGNNLTGASIDIPPETQFERLRAIVPGLRKIGTLYNPREMGPVIHEASAVAERMGLELVTVEVKSEKDVPDALASLEKGIDALWMTADSIVYTPSSIRFILLYTLRGRIPFMGLSPSYVRAGTLFALSIDYRDVGRQAGGLVMEIIEGKKPAELPITVPRKTYLTLNLITAERIDLKLSPDILEGADEIIGER